MVIYGFTILSADCNTINPPVRKTQVRGPLASTHARRLPVPEIIQISNFIYNSTPPANCIRSKPLRPGKRQRRQNLTLRHGSANYRERTCVIRACNHQNKRHEDTH